MADTVKYTSELKLVCKFDDDDTRTITFDNPKNSLTKSDIQAIESDMITKQPIIGDKTGAAFVKFTRAYILNQTKYTLDLSR